MASHVLDDFASEPRGETAVDASHPGRSGVREVHRFEKVYDQHYAYVHRVMRHLGVVEAQLDDAVQDAFMVVHQKLDGFDGRHPITTWLYAIVINVARRYRKTQIAARNFESDEDLGETGAVEVDFELGRKLEIAERALNTLDKDKREAFVLGEIEQMSVVEIAAILGAPVDTIYSRLRAAKEAFGKAVRRAELTQRRVP